MAGSKRKQPADGHGSGPISKKPCKPSNVKYATILATWEAENYIPSTLAHTPFNRTIMHTPPPIMSTRGVPLHEMYQLHALRTPREVTAMRNAFKAKLKRQSNGMEEPKLEAFIRAAQYTPSCLAHTITTTTSINPRPIIPTAGSVDKTPSSRSVYHPNQIAKRLAAEYQPSIVAHTDSTNIVRLPPKVIRRPSRMQRAKSWATHYKPSVLAHTILSGIVANTPPPKRSGVPAAAAGASKPKRVKLTSHHHALHDSLINPRDSTTYTPATAAHTIPTSTSAQLANVIITPPQMRVPVDRNGYGDYHIPQNAGYMFLTFAMVPTLVPTQPTSAITTPPTSAITTPPTSVTTTPPTSATITSPQKRMSRKEIGDGIHYLPSAAAHTVFSSTSLGLAVGASVPYSGRGSRKPTKGAYRRPTHASRSSTTRSESQNNIASPADDSFFLPPGPRAAPGSHPTTANSLPTTQSTTPGTPGLLPVSANRDTRFQAREPMALHPKSLAVWGGTGQTDPGILKPELRHLIDSDGYIDPSKVFETTSLQCLGGCGESYGTFEALAKHLLYEGCNGSLSLACDFELSLQGCNGHAGLHKRLNDYHYYLNHSIDCRCGRVFPSIFHAINHIATTRSDHEVLPPDQCRPLLRFTIDTFGSAINRQVTESGRGFFTRANADLTNFDMEFEISRFPLYPPDPYTTYVKRHSSHLVTSMASPLALQVEYQALTGIYNDVITYQVPHCESHQFPLVFAPPISHWMAHTIARLGGNDPSHAGESTFIKNIFRNVRETAELHNLISQCPSALPLVLSIADGFSSHLGLLAYFFGTLRMFIHAVKFPDIMLSRISMPKGSQKWRDWLTELATGAHAQVDFRLLLTPDGFWVDMMSLPFAVQVVRRWRSKHNLPHGVLYPVYEPIFEMLEHLQDWKDNGSAMVRTVGQRIDWVGLRSDGFLTTSYMQHAEQHLPHLL